MKKQYIYLFYVMLLFSFFGSYSQDNVHLDCDDALEICDNQDIMIWNNTFGTQELDSSNNGCLNSNENQSIWLTFTITSGTTLDFDITPLITGDDYDFAIYGPDISCDNLPLPIRCDYDFTTGLTGLNTPGTGLGYDTTLNVQAGETYYLLIDNHPAGSQSNGFNLSWGGNAVLDCCFQNVAFHFEHQNGVEDTTFNICEDVFLDGSASLNTSSYFMDLWTVDSSGDDHWIASNGWTQGQPNFVNVTDTFENNSTNPITFQVGVTYRVKLALNVPGCGWVSVTHDFVLTEEIINVDFHFEHENGDEDTVFNLCEDVFLDGSITLNTGSYFMDLWTVDSSGDDHWISSNGWTQGSPDLVNVSDIFRNNATHPITFQAGVTYRVKLAISDPLCGWQSVTHDFIYTDGDISSAFDIVDYFCHDGVYDVTVTAQDSFPSQWWRVYETSVEGQTGDSVTVFPSVSGIQSGTTTTFTNLDPNKFYYIKHGVWTPNCPWQETRTPLDRDCCIDNPYIEPYWEFCESNNVCELDTWPIRVLDAEGHHVTLSDGVQFSWVSSNGNTSNSDGVYTTPFEEWVLTLTYPDGCVYTTTYKKICCTDDIHLEIEECITESEVAILIEQLESDKSNISKEKYIQYSKSINSSLQNSKAGKADCDPCDDETVFLKVVNGAGELVTNFVSIVWGDGLATDSPFRVGDINVTYSVTVVLSVNDGHDTCTYTDSFIYECEVKCSSVTAPVNAQVNGNILSWDAVVGADHYIITSPVEYDCECRDQITLPWYYSTTNNSLAISGNLRGKCFAWQVVAVCRDGSTSQASEIQCYNGGEIIIIDDFPIEVTDKENITIIPNPTNGYMTFKLEANYDSTALIEVFNHYGHKVKALDTQFNKLSSNSISWDGSKLEKGVYFITITTNKKTIYKQVVIH